MGTSRGYKTPISIEDLVVWAYRDQKVDLIVDRGVGLFDQEREADGIQVRRVSADGCAQIARNGAMGTRVDYSGYPSAAIHPDAEAVHAVVETGKPVQKGLVKDFGRTGMAPDWLPGARPIVEPDIKPNGNPRIVYRERNATGLLMRHVLTFDEIVFQRRVYAIWWEELARVAGVFVDNPTALTSFAVSGVAAGCTPWGGGDWVMMMAAHKGLAFA